MRHSVCQTRGNCHWCRHCRCPVGDCTRTGRTKRRLHHLSSTGYDGSNTHRVCESGHRVSSIAFHYVDDIATCFQEVYRVLKPQGLFVFSIEHPFSAIMDGTTLLPYRSYFDTDKVVLCLEVSDEVGYAFAENRRTVSDCK